MCRVIKYKLNPYSFVINYEKLSLSLFLSLYLFISLSVHMYLPTCTCICIDCLSIYQSIYLSTYFLSIHLSLSLSFSLILNDYMFTCISFLFTSKEINPPPPPPTLLIICLHIQNTPKVSLLLMITNDVY